MRREGDYRVYRFRKQFGTWTEAVEQAGFEPNRTHKLTEEQLLSELHRLRDVLGRLPNSQDVAEQGKHSVATYQRHFGSWSAAFEVGFADQDE